MQDKKTSALSRKVIIATCLVVVALVGLWSLVVWPMLSAYVASMGVALGGIFLFAALGWLIPYMLGVDLAIPSGVSLSTLTGLVLCAALGGLLFALATVVGIAIPFWTILPIGAALLLLIAAVDFFDWS